MALECVLLTDARVSLFVCECIRALVPPSRCQDTKVGRHVKKLTKSADAKVVELAQVWRRQRGKRDRQTDRQRERERERESIATLNIPRSLRR